jgi:hypothetical protein
LHLVKAVKIYTKVKTSVPSTNNNIIGLSRPEQYKRGDIEVLIYAKDALQTTHQAAEQEKNTNDG